MFPFVALRNYSCPCRIRSHAQHLGISHGAAPIQFLCAKTAGGNGTSAVCAISHSIDRDFGDGLRARAVARTYCWCRQLCSSRDVGSSVHPDRVDVDRGIWCWFGILPCTGPMVDSRGTLRPILPCVVRHERHLFAPWQVPLRPSPWGGSSGTRCDPGLEPCKLTSCYERLLWRPRYRVGGCNVRRTEWRAAVRVPTVGWRPRGHRIITTGSVAFA